MVLPALLVLVLAVSAVQVIPPTARGRREAAFYETARRAYAQSPAGPEREEPAAGAAETEGGAAALGAVGASAALQARCGAAEGDGLDGI